MGKSGIKRLNTQKAVRFAIVVNALQVVAVAAAIAYVLTQGRGPDRLVELGVLALALLIASLGAALDILEARNAERIARQADMLEAAYGQLEDLNGTLRKQRHDFTNHLQVVFSLMELGEYPDAMRYVESVYSDIKRTGMGLRTAIPAVNALIAAKRAECEERGIDLKLDIRSNWQELPVPGWEMCRVLGNLIDNARDAVMELPDGAARRIGLVIDETPGGFGCQVTNNGPAIDPAARKSIFRAGFTTKAAGHGLGLSIVRDIIEAHGGAIGVESDAAKTCFSLTLPRPSQGK